METAYRVVWKPRYTKLGFKRTNQANSHRVLCKLSTVLYGNHAIRNSDLTLQTRLIFQLKKIKQKLNEKKNFCKITFILTVRYDLHNNF